MLLTFISPRTLITITLILVLTSLAFGYPWPVSTASPQTFITDLALFVGYLYLARTLIRLPIALALMIRYAIQSRRRRGMQ